MKTDNVAPDFGAARGNAPRLGHTGMLSLLVVLVACGPQPGSIALDGPSTITLHSLEPVQLPLATVISTDGSALEVQPTLTWTVQPAELATVDATTGMLMPMAEGTATVTAQVGAISSSLTVAVAVPDSIELTGLASGDVLSVGETREISASVMNDGAPMEDLVATFESNAPDVVDVSPEGALRALSPGDATVMAKAGTTVRAVTVTVNSPALTDQVAPEGSTADL